MEGLETVTTCPLGSECREVKDGKIHHCAWYIKLQGKNPQTGEPVDDYRCAIAWQPILAIEGNGASHSIAASVQSLRNETVKRQDAALGAFINAKTISSD